MDLIAACGEATLRALLGQQHAATMTGKTKRVKPSTDKMLRQALLRPTLPRPAAAQHALNKCLLQNIALCSVFCTPSEGLTRAPLRERARRAHSLTPGVVRWLAGG